MVEILHNILLGLEVLKRSVNVRKYIQCKINAHRTVKKMHRHNAKRNKDKRYVWAKLTLYLHIIISQM